MSDNSAFSPREVQWLDVAGGKKRLLAGVERGKLVMVSGFLCE